MSCARMSPFLVLGTFFLWLSLLGGPNGGRACPLHSGRGGRPRGVRPRSPASHPRGSRPLGTALQVGKPVTMVSPAARLAQAT